MTGAAFFDLDGTLAAGRSCEMAFAAELIREGLLRPRQAVAALAFQLRYAPTFGLDTPKKNKAYLAGLRVNEVADLGRRFAQLRLVRTLRPPLLRRLRDHQAAGEAVVLLTGAPTFIAEPLAEALGMDGCLAARCAVAAGRFTNSPPPVHPFGSDKLRLAEEYCRERRLTLEECSAYADSVHDLPLLLAVGRPVAVFPDAPLLRAARRRGWTVIDGSPSRPRAAIPT
jgi:HAD superfamily hydrolase (TIGR01490 family)